VPAVDEGTAATPLAADPNTRPLSNFLLQLGSATTKAFRHWSLSAFLHRYSELIGQTEEVLRHLRSDYMPNDRIFLRMVAESQFDIIRLHLTQ
jgi:hypothetical protein